MALDAKRRGRSRFEVANVSGREMKARVEVKPKEAAQAAWFKVEGETERDFPLNRSEPVWVAIAVPAAIAAGDYSFRLDVVSVENPDDDFTEGPYVSFVVPEVIRIPWWRRFWWIPVAALLLVGVGVGLWWLLSGDGAPELPGVTGVDIAKAEAVLQQEGYSIGTVIKRHTGSSAPGTVLEQKAGGEKTVDLYVEPYLLITQKLDSDPLAKFRLAVEVPDLRKQQPRQASVLIRDLVLNFEGQPRGESLRGESGVVDQSPAPKEVVTPGEKITVEYAAPAPKGPSRNDLFQNVKVRATGAIFRDRRLPGDARAAQLIFDGLGTCFGSERGNAILMDKLPGDTLHFVEFATPAPVSLEGIRLFGTHDTRDCRGVANRGQRGLSKFRLLGALNEKGRFEPIVSRDIRVTDRYVHGIDGLLVEQGSLAVKAQFFRAEFTQFLGMPATPFGGPRIMELDGFGTALEAR